MSESGEIRKTYPVPIKSNLYVEDGQKIVPGDIIAKVPRNPIASAATLPPVCQR